VGKALVTEFSRHGYDVTFQYFKSDEEASQIQAATSARAFKSDLSQPASNLDGPFDILVNNAAVNISSELIGDTELDAWNLTIAVNLTAPFILSKKFLPHMVSQHWGRIINISSIYGLRATGWNGPYNASKHGLSGLTKTIAKEYASHGITSNEICPGPIHSNMMQRIAEEEAPAEDQTPEEYLADYAAKIPAGRFAEPAEVAALAVFLASDEAGYLNGVSVPIDGGWIA